MILFRDSLKNPSTNKIMHSNQLLVSFSKLLCLIFYISDLLKLISLNATAVRAENNVLSKVLHGLLPARVLNLIAPVSKSALLLLLLLLLQ